MSLYDGLKDAAKIVQKADNIELLQKLLDLEAQALEMQDEIRKLKEENFALKEKKDLSAKIERHSESYITIKDDPLPLRYCTHCWDADRLLVQVVCDEKDGTFSCPHCEMSGIYDYEQNKQYFESIQYHSVFR